MNIVPVYILVRDTRSEEQKPKKKRDRISKIDQHNLRDFFLTRYKEHSVKDPSGRNIVSWLHKDFKKVLKDTSISRRTIERFINDNNLKDAF